MWKMLYMQWEFKGILRNPLYNNLNFPVKINVRSGPVQGIFGPGYTKACFY